MDKNFYQTYFEIEKNHWLMKVRRSIVFDVLKQVAPYTNKILDFGCGSGYMVSKLEDAGYHAYGLDTSLEAIEFGRLRGIRNLDLFEFRRFHFRDNNFNAVLLLDVLEHLEDEAWIIKEIERVLAPSPSGVAIIMVPAFMFLWGVQDDVSHHYRRYTLDDLINTIKKSSNFQIIKKTYFNTFLFFPIMVVRLMSRWFNLKSRQSDFDINHPILNKILYWIFNFERFLLQRINFPFGVSILLVVKKVASKNDPIKKDDLMPDQYRQRFGGDHIMLPMGNSSHTHLPLNL